MPRSKLLGSFFPLVLVACGSAHSGAGGGASLAGAGTGALAGADASAGAGPDDIASAGSAEAGSGATGGMSGGVGPGSTDGGADGFCGNGGPCLYYEEHFDTKECAPGWSLQGFWRCGEPDSVLEPSVKSAPHALISDGADASGPYAGIATSPAIDLSIAGQPLLEFYLSMKTTRNDALANGHPFVSGLRVRARVGEQVFELPNVDPIYTGYGMWSESLQYSFARHRVDLSAFSGQIIRLEFEFDSDYDTNDDVLIDDVSVYDASLVPAIPESLAVPRCTANATRCAVQLAQVCSPSGTWQTTQECPYICTDGGSCGGVCRPYESTCDPDHPGTRLVCEGSGLAETSQACLDECAAGHCRGVYLNEGFEGPSAPTGWVLSGDWGIANAPGITPVLLPEDGSSLAARLTQVETNRDYADDFAQTPELDLTSATEPVFHFLACMLTEKGISGFDTWVRTSDGDGQFELLTPEYPAYDDTVKDVGAWSGLSLVFRPSQVDLTRFAGHKVSLRFALASDGTNQGDASVYIDRAAVMERALVPLSIQVPSPSVFSAVVGQPFSAQVHAIGGSSRAVWSIVSRTDADWLSIDPATGTLSGTPSEAKLASFTARIEEPDVKDNFSELGFEVQVDAN